MNYDFENEYVGKSMSSSEMAKRLGVSEDIVMKWGDWYRAGSKSDRNKEE